MEACAPGIGVDTDATDAVVRPVTEAPRNERIPPGKWRLNRRIFLGAAGAAAAGMALYSGEIARHELVTEHVNIAIDRLPEAFAGMRIVQISDLHYAEYTEPYYIREVVERVNALHADMVLLTGDFISMAPIDKQEARGYAPLCAELLSRLTCPLRYGVMGNHDWSVDANYVSECMRAVGITILDNQYVPLEREGKRIWLAGLADALSPFIHIEAAIPKYALADGEPLLLMGHEPDTLDEVARYGVDLMLSGHTHGGQVRIPFMRPYFLPPLGKRYVAGHFTRRRTQLYVNRGVGTVGLPFRLNCPSEITEITLRPA